MPKVLYANTHHRDMFHLTGVEIHDPFFYLETSEGRFVFLDHREFEVYRAHAKDPDIEVVLLNPLMAEASALPGEMRLANKLAIHLFRKYGLEGTVVNVPPTFPLDMTDALREAGMKLEVRYPFHPERLRKSDAEAEAIHDAIQRTHSAYQHIEKVLRDATIEGDVIMHRGEALTSERLATEVEHVLLDQDLINMDGMIISCGPHAAIPHHRGEGLIRPNETIICDIFPRHRATGYCADMTRTYVKGTPSDTVLRMYAAVREAQVQAISAIRPGVLGADVHAICVRIIKEHGFDVGDRGFTHGTGHGLGLDVHEEPYLSSGSRTPLEPGHVVTVEPGLYYPAHGGVRLEDVVLVTPDGCRNLTQYPKELVIA